MNQELPEPFIDKELIEQLNTMVHELEILLTGVNTKLDNLLDNNNMIVDTDTINGDETTS